MGLIPLFPLNVVVFPGMAVPLFVFEARYKRLVKISLEAEPERFAIVLAGGEPPPAVKAVGTFVDILRASMNPDGSYQLLVHGQERCRIDVAHEELVPDVDGSSRPLLHSRSIEWPLTRGDPNEERLLAWDAIDTFRRYARDYFAFEAREKIDSALPDDPVYQASFICANIRVSLENRQRLLEAESLSDRLRLVRTLMVEGMSAHDPAAEGDA